MRRKLVLLLALILILECAAGCGKTQDNYTQGGVEYTCNDGDLDCNQYYLGTNDCHQIAEGPDAFYFYSGDYFFYMDKTTYEVNFLCQKPQCLHNEEEDYERNHACGAYLSVPLSIVYYNEKLYILQLVANSVGDLNTVINRYSLQGEFEKEIAVVPSSVMSMIQHKGIAYITYREGMEYEDEEWGDRVLASVNLQDGTQTKMAAWSSEEVMSAGNAFVLSNRLYVKVFRYLNSKDGDMNSYLAVFDLNTGEYSTISEPNELGIAVFFPYGDKIVYSKNRDSQGQNNDDLDALYVADADGKNEKTLLHMKYADGQAMTFDDIILVSNRMTQNIDSRNPEMIAIYQGEKQIGEFNLYDIPWANPDESMASFAQRYADAGKVVLVFVLTETGPEAVIAFEKEKLAKGIAEPIVLFEPKLAACYGYAGG